MSSIEGLSYTSSGGRPREAPFLARADCEDFGWVAPGRGKRGGTRVIYFWHPASNGLLMLFAFAKNGIPSLAPEQGESVAANRRLGVLMKPDLFEELRESVTEGGAILRRRKRPSRESHFGEPDVRAVRESYRLSQSKFAALMGISPATLRNWEQGRRKPEGSARILLRIVEKHPEAVLDVVSTATLKRRA